MSLNIPLLVLLASVVGSSAFSGLKLPVGSGQSRIPAFSRGGTARRQRGLGLRMEISDEMRKRLKKENDAPLRFPLLWMGAVVGGKGLTDAMITGATSFCPRVSIGTRFSARDQVGCHFRTTRLTEVERCAAAALALHCLPSQSSSHQWAASSYLSRRPCSVLTLLAWWLGPPSFSGEPTLRFSPLPYLFLSGAIKSLCIERESRKMLFEAN